MMAYESFVMVDKSLVSLIVFHGTKIDEQILKCFANLESFIILYVIWTVCHHYQDSFMTSRFLPLAGD